jgi:NAD(P)-dependent dehydrogenase (short-subunit alcohol dehydrogenase family)
MEMNGKVCLVTGANTGIGRATAEALAKAGANVVLLCRSKERGEQARSEIAAATGNSKVELLIADLSLLRETRRAAEEFKSKHDRLHVLVNNAAVFLPKREETDEGIEKTLATNFLSHFLLTHLLLDTLKASAPARIVNVASKTGGAKVDFEDLMLKNGYSIMKAVGTTKLMQVMFTQDLARKLEGSGVTVNCLHPGLVKTPLLDDVPWLMRKLFHLFSKPPEAGARTPVWLATSNDVANESGKMFTDCKPMEMSKPAVDPVARQRLWTESARLTGLTGV